jgi:glutamine synthetase adenylyltransferase
MNKLNLLKRAQNLYEIENFNADKIAKKLGISRRTVFNWAKKYKWNEGKVRIKDFANQFSPELYSIGSKLLQKTNDDLDNGRELNKHSINAIEEIVKIISKNEKEEFLKTQNNKAFEQPSQGLTPEFIKQIQHDFLGIDF